MANHWKFSKITSAPLHLSHTRKPYSHFLPSILCLAEIGLLYRCHWQFGILHAIKNSYGKYLHKCHWFSCLQQITLYRLLCAPYYIPTSSKLSLFSHSVLSCIDVWLLVLLCMHTAYEIRFCNVSQFAEVATSCCHHR